MSGDHSQDMVGKEHKHLTLAEGRGPALHDPSHALREETIGKKGIEEEKKLHKATLEEHREARLEENVPDPLVHNKNSPLPHHHEQHAQHHSTAEEHKVGADEKA